MFAIYALSIYFVNLSRKLTNLAGYLVVSPRLDSQDGNSIIPAGSTQDVDVSIQKASIGGGSGTEEHPQFPLTYLDYATGASITNSQPLSFWYSATGHSNQDTFMLHGGFFSSMRVSISNPYIFANNALIFLPLQGFVACPLAVQQLEMCPLATDIQNRTGHPLKWTLTLFDSSTRLPVVTPVNGLIAGTPGAEVPGTFLAQQMGIELVEGRDLAGGHRYALGPCPVDKNEGFVKGEDPGRCASTAGFAAGSWV
jgi:hypothetical protein